MASKWFQTAPIRSWVISYIGHIGYYYPAEVWISEYGKLYAKYEYQDEIECFPDVFSLIERELRQCTFDSAVMKTVEALDGKL